MDFLINECFRDFEKFAAQARDWQLDFIQLDTGPAEFQLLQAGIGGTQICRARFNRRLLQRGTIPRGLRSFVIPVDPGLDLQWRQHHVTANDLMIFPENSELESLSLPGFDVIIYSVPVDDLARICESEQLADHRRLLADREVVRIAPAAMRGLRHDALACTRAITARHDDARRRADFHERIGHDLACGILVAIARSCGLDRMPAPLRRRSASIRSAIELIDSCGPEGLTVREICQRTNCSERTLQYGFKQQFGVSPKAFLQAWRLNRVRNDLGHPEFAAATIADVANRYGFWHMGQFARDYRRMFAELPSETRKRVDPQA